MQRSHFTHACMCIELGLFTALALSMPAWAQESALPASPEPPQPPQQAGPRHPSPVAAERFAEGAALFKQWHFDEAEAKLREALAHWEHPIIHLYLGRALEKQGRLVEAHASLQQALRPGVEALPPEDVGVAEELKTSLESRLAQIEGSCDVPGAEVSLDGEPWFTAPGRPHRMISAGQHVLIARKPGYFPVAEPVSLIPGKRTRVVLRMAADVIHIERRWQPWQPWAMAGAGLATSAAGGLLLWQAARDYEAFEREAARCGQAISCPRLSTRRRDAGARKDVIGTASLITGGALLATGVLGVLLNQPRTHRSDPADSGLEIDLAPLISSEAAGLSAHIQF